MKELDRIFFGQPVAWREGFFYAIECKDARADYLECIKSLDVGNERLYFHQGWEYATKFLNMHRAELY